MLILPPVRHQLLTLQRVNLYDGHGHWIIQEPGWQAIAGEVLAWLSSTLR